MHNIEELLNKLALEGGKIVSSKDCTIPEISLARSQNKMYVDDNGLGFIHIPATYAESKVIKSN